MTSSYEVYKTISQLDTYSQEAIIRSGAKTKEYAFFIQTNFASACLLGSHSMGSDEKYINVWINKTNK